MPLVDSSVCVTSGVSDDPLMVQGNLAGLLQHP